jgi:hypothetical protein
MAAASSGFAGTAAMIHGRAPRNTRKARTGIGVRHAIRTISRILFSFLYSKKNNLYSKKNKVEKKSGYAVFRSEEPRGTTTTPPSRAPRLALHPGPTVVPSRPPRTSRCSSIPRGLRSHLRGPVPSQTLTAAVALRPHAVVVVRTPSTTPLPPTSHAAGTSPDPPSSVSFHREHCPSEQAASSGNGPSPECANVKSEAAGQNLVSSARPYRW